MDHITDAQLLLAVKKVAEKPRTFYTSETTWRKMQNASVLLYDTNTQGISFACLKCMASVICTVAFWRTLQIVGNKTSLSERLNENVC